MKFDRLDGINIIRWKEKMKFLLIVLKIFYILDLSLKFLSEFTAEDFIVVVEECKKQEEDDMFCRGYILNFLSDRF